MCCFVRFYSFLFELRDAASVILHPSLSSAWSFFLETGGFQRDWSQASLESTAVTLLTAITEEDKHFSTCELKPLIDLLSSLLTLHVESFIALL